MPEANCLKKLIEKKKKKELIINRIKEQTPFKNLRKGKRMLIRKKKGNKSKKH